MSISVTAISDLHGHYPKLEGGDLLIVAGDLTARDTWQEYFQLQRWLNEQRYGEIIFIAGNHDNLIQNSDVVDDLLYEHTYLQDSGTTWKGLKIWGSPWTKSFEGMNPHCKAFTVDTEEELADKWALIPDDVDILVTHSPPYSVMDDVQNYSTGRIENCGSRELGRVYLPKCKLHVYGHIHEGYGVIRPDELFERYYVNASHVNERYRPVNKPIRVIL